MEVVRVEKVKHAAIHKEAELVKAEEEKRKIEIDAEARKNAEADKEKQFLEAAALLEVKDKESQGIAKIGAAEAEALKLKELAPVTAQITLAKEIGENEGYQHYLVTIRQVEAGEKIGIEQAKALVSADMKIIANGGDVQDGMSKIGDILSSKGGPSVGAMLEGLAQTHMGTEFLNKFTPSNDIDKNSS